MTQEHLLWETVLQNIFPFLERGSLKAVHPHKKSYCFNYYGISVLEKSITNGLLETKLQTIHQSILKFKYK
jgi:hypothetical protein